MTSTTDDRKELRGLEDFEKLVNLVRGYLVSQSVLRVTVGSELVIHLGDALPYQSSAMRDLGIQRGAYQLRVMRAPWVVWSLEGKGVALSSGIFDPFVRRLTEEVETILTKQLQEAQVEDVKGREVDIGIAFSNGYALSVLSPYSDAQPGQALWKLRTPDKMAFHAFSNPIPYWSFLKTDVPRREG